MPPADDRPRRPADPELTFGNATESAGAGRMASRLLWRHAVAHSVAGLVFAAVSTVLLFRFGGMEFFPLRTTVVIWAHAWPTVLVLGLLVGRDRRLQALIVFGYLGVLALICVSAELRGTEPLPMLRRHRARAIVQPAIIWALNAAPSAFLLLVPQPHDPVDRPAGAGVRVRPAARQPHRDRRCCRLKPSSERS